MVKICHMTSVHSSNDVRIFEKECVSLAHAGYEVYLVARGESRVEKGVNVIGCGKPSGGRLSRMMFFTKKIYKAALDINADIYHFHDPELIPYGLKLKKKGKKVIFDSHEDVSQQIKAKKYIPSVFRAGIVWMCNKYLQYALKKYNAVISVTPHICDKLKKINNNTVMITNYPLLKNCNIYSNDKKENRPICFAGGVTAQWSHEYIIKAISNIPDITYEIYGDASLKYINTLKILSGWEKVKYCGKIPYNEVQKNISLSFAGMAVCQYSDNMGGKIGSLGNTKLFEYMSAEIPVICTDFSLWQKIVKENNCGICVSPKNVKEIEEAINYLLFHPEEAKNMGRNGRKAVMEKYNWSIEEEKLTKLYKRLSQK